VGANADSSVGLWTLAGSPDAMATGVVAYAPRGRILATAAAGAIHMRSLADGALLATTGNGWLVSVAGRAMAMARSPDGDTVATASDDRPTISLWDVSSRTMTTIPGAPPDGVTAMAFSRDGRMLAAAGRDAAKGTGTVGLWIRVGQRWDQQSPILSRFGAVTAIAFSPVDDTIAMGSSDGPISLAAVP